jgi:hypothetical protein
MQNVKLGFIRKQRFINELLARESLVSIKDNIPFHVRNNYYRVFRMYVFVTRENMQGRNICNVPFNQSKI